MSPREQCRHAHRIAHRLSRDLSFLTATHLALYWAADGEPDLRPTLRSALNAGKRCYLPILSPIRIPHYCGKLWFAAYEPDAPMRRNRLGIWEPTPSHREPIGMTHLDLILMPLVGFDANCHRIGMGGGFYDRTLAMTHKRPGSHRPRLIGIAHECQRLDSIAPAPWDVRLDAVVTELASYRC